MTVWAWPRAKSAVHRLAATLNVSRRFRKQEFPARYYGGNKYAPQTEFYHHRGTNLLAHPPHHGTVRLPDRQRAGTDVRSERREVERPVHGLLHIRQCLRPARTDLHHPFCRRSEERRVGKEGRS